MFVVVVEKNKVLYFCLCKGRFSAMPFIIFKEDELNAMAYLIFKGNDLEAMAYTIFKVDELNAMPDIISMGHYFYQGRSECHATHYFEGHTILFF